MSDVDELILALPRFDLVAYLESKGGAQDGKDEWLVFCPHCSREKVSVNPFNRMWRCFACQDGFHAPQCEFCARGDDKHGIPGQGNVFKLVEWLEGWKRQQVAKFIIQQVSGAADLSGPIQPSVFGPPEISSRSKLPCGLPEKALAVTAILPYMMRRGITLDDAQTFGLGYVPAEAGGWLANRIIFPVWHQGTCLYWQARAMWDLPEHRERWPGDKFRKSLNPLSEKDGHAFLGKSDVVGNLELASRFPRPCIVEGPTSGLRVGPDALWTFGKSLAPQQAALLIQRGIKAVDFMWDGPSRPEPDGTVKEPLGAWPKMIKDAALLAPYMDVRLVFIPRGDPGDYTRAENAQFRNHSKPLVEVSAWSL